LTSPDGHTKRQVLKSSLPLSPTVLLLVDFINPLQFDGADALSPAALRAAQAAAALKQRIGRRGVQTVYVNDNFGQWQSDFKALVADCRRRRGAPARLARTLAPAPSDLTVLKPRHSAFHATPLQLLLTQMEAKQLIITGLATDLCVMFSAMDAFARGYRLWIPQDCTAAESEPAKRAALDWMAFALKAQTDASDDAGERDTRA
jgi:nicotinamidase-related amidase